MTFSPRVDVYYCGDPPKAVPRDGTATRRAHAGQAARKPSRPKAGSK